MNPTVMEALEEWRDANEHLRDSAVNALRLALPGLDHTRTPTYCCPVMLAIDKPGDLGAGRVCIDTDTLATVELSDIPNTVLGEASDAVFGVGWFEEAELPLAEEDPGTFHYDDEATGAEWSLTIGEDGLGKLLIESVPVPYAVELLDALNTARTRQQQKPGPELADD